MSNQSAWDELSDLLRARESAEKREGIDAEIHGRFGRERAIMITDMEGFSRRTRDRGIIDVLQLIGRMVDLCLPHIEKYDGNLVKTVGDDLIVLFETPESAVRAALGMQEACEADGLDRHADEQIRLAAGIGWGYVLDLDGTDVFGDEVNRASKLGEDLAATGEILVTHSARQTLTELDWSLEKRSAQLSGMVFEHYCVHRS